MIKHEIQVRYNGSHLTPLLRKLQSKKKLSRLVQTPCLTQIERFVSRIFV